MLLPFKDHHNNLSIPVMLPCQTNPLQVSKPSQPYNFDSIVPSELSLWYTHLVLSIQITSSGGENNPDTSFANISKLYITAGLTVFITLS